MLKSRKIFFIDEKLEKERTIIDGVEVLNPSHAYKKFKNNLKITSGIFQKNFNFYDKKLFYQKKYGWNLIHFNKILRQKKTSFYFWGHNKSNQQFNNGIKKVKKFFKDKESFQVLKQHLLLRCNKLDFVDTSQMWDVPQLLKYKRGKNTFVDIGAFDGDSLEDFLKSGLKSDKVIAFEPDEKNFKKLKNYAKKISKKKIILKNEAVFNFNGAVSFNFNGDPSSFISDKTDVIETKAKCRSLDFLLNEKNRIIIKIDAEGSEWEIISCAYRFIRTRKPVLAISLYHKINDIIDIPLLFERQKKHFNFFLRAHSNNGSDLYLYCIPKAKVISKLGKHQKFSIFSKRFSFEEFNRIAGTDIHSSAHASGFPDNFRNQSATAIHQDIIGKLNLNNLKSKKVIEIGPGISPLPHMMASFCRSHGISLKFIDGPNVLENLPTATFIELIPDQFPKNIDDYLEKCRNAGAIISYSVSQYLGSFHKFLEFINCATSLLAPGGRLLLGDIPNRDMRMRYLNSISGKQNCSYIFKNKTRYKRFLKTQSTFLNDENLLNILQTGRRSGYHAWICPQNSQLPQSEKREDLLIEKNK